MELMSLAAVEVLKAHLMSHEGVRDKPYVCSAGKLTIGVGRNLDDNGLRHDEIMYLLDRDVTGVLQELAQYEWFAELNEARKIVIANMAFNMGVPKLCAFRKMILAIIGKDYNAAANEMIRSKWAKQVGGRAVMLSGIMRTGVVKGVG